MNLPDTSTTREAAAVDMNVVDTNVVDTRLHAEYGEYGIFIVRKSDGVVVRFDPRVESYPPFSLGDRVKIGDTFWEMRLRGRTGILEKIQPNGVNGTTDNIFMVRISERELTPVKLREVCFADPAIEQQRRRTREMIMETRAKYRIISNPEELNVLRGKKSKWGDFCYAYDDRTIDMLKKKISLPDSLYIMVTDEKGAFVAFCATDRDWREQDYFFLRELFVVPTYHGRGIGMELIKRIMMHARQKRAVGVVAEADFENARAKGIYGKMGFDEWETPQWGGLQGENRITYKKLWSPQKP